MHSKENHKQNENIPYGLGENICKCCDQKGLNFQNIQTAHMIQYQKTKNNKKNKTKKPQQPNQKIGRRPK